MKNWLMFGLLGLIWGSSFLLIKIGLRELNPFLLVSLRLGLAAIAFAIFLVILRKMPPRDPATLLKLALVGVTNNAIPFLLITWGEGTIDSGLAGVLNATVPLFSLVIAHIFLPDDKISVGKFLGLVTGFIGIILLATRTADPNHTNSLGGQLAVLGAAVSYAISAVYIRRNLRGVDAMVQAGVTLSAGAIVVNVFTLLIGQYQPSVSVISADVVLSIAGLGLVNTFIAYILYFSLIRNWGASRSTMVTYLTPPISLVLGILFASEQPDIKLIIGAVFIVGGVALANLLRMPVRSAMVSETSSVKP